MSDQELSIATFCVVVLAVSATLNFFYCEVVEEVVKQRRMYDAKEEIRQAKLKAEARVREQQRAQRRAEQQVKHKRSKKATKEEQ